MKYFLTFSIIFHLLAVGIFQGAFKSADITNGHKIIEIGYILSNKNHGGGNTGLKSKAETKSKDKAVIEAKKEEIVLSKENNEQLSRNEVNEENRQKNAPEDGFGGKNPYSGETGKNSANGSNLADLEMILWFKEVKSKIEKLKKYPEEARKKNIEGETLLEISFKNNGFIDRVNIFKSSGNNILDEEAVRIVKAAEPFSPPKEKNLSKISLRVPIKFSIKK